MNYATIYRYDTSKIPTLADNRKKILFGLTLATGVSVLLSLLSIYSLT